ncbi:hypothetical protein Q5L94_01480 [Idiomarina sp. Sol25]|uniref:hypothetical protein n=1 Tax=Idiomarina sp. Sol25 TaxID=3064000 RepID=UPI00294AB42B|nr:hypothetical protein [Idiomarina sp. Sol25]MDV6326712.1 hypothetical protein [Idiomarina sp. Sol25]
MNKILIFILCICFLIGGVIHLYDNIAFGVLPYNFAPLWMNVYWTLLGVLDLLIVYLLIYRLRTGLTLGLLVMLSDVVINSYAYYILAIFTEAYALQLQSLFLGFTIAASIALWKRKV